MTELGGDHRANNMGPQMRMGMRFIAAFSIPMKHWFLAAIFSK